MLDLFDVDVPRDVGMLWGTDYLNRKGIAKSNMYDNRPEETKYIYTDDDSQGNSSMAATPMRSPAKGAVPPVRGFWSLTLYNSVHFFNPNQLNRYSLGTKNKTLKYDTDGSLTPVPNRPVRIKRATGCRPRAARSRSISALTGRTRHSSTASGSRLPSKN